MSGNAQTQQANDSNRAMEDRVSMHGQNIRHCVLLPVAFSLLAAGCGYQFRVEGPGPTIGGAAAETGEPSSAPPPRVTIRTLRNATFEPNLETRFTNYLRHEFASGSGATVVPDGEVADLVVSGDILSVVLPTLSFTQTATLESRAEVVVAIRVEESRTKRLVWSHLAKGQAEFYVTQDLQFNRVLQNRALEQAGRYIAEDLASRFLMQLESGRLSKPVANTAPDSAPKP